MPFHEQIVKGSLVRKYMYTNLKDVNLYGIVLGYVLSESYGGDLCVRVYWFKSDSGTLRRVPYVQYEFVSMLRKVEKK